MSSPLRIAAALLLAVLLLGGTLVLVGDGGPPGGPMGTSRPVGPPERAAGDPAAGAALADALEDGAAGGTARWVVDEAPEDALALARRRAAAQLVGVVVDADGAALPGARVLATTRRSSVPVGLDAYLLDGPTDLPARADTAAVAAAETDGEGRFEVGPAASTPELRPGRGLELLVRARGHVPARPPEQPMGVELPHDVGTIALQAGLTVTGKVLGPDGLPLEGARLAFGQPDLSGLAVRAAPTRGLPFAVTGEDGRFTLDELRPGRFWIMAALDGLTPAWEEAALRPGETLRGVDLQLGRAATIAGACEGIPAGLVTTVVAAAADDQEEVPRIERRWRELPIDPATGAFGGAAFVPGLEYDLRVAVVDPLSGERDLTRAVDRLRVRAPDEGVALEWEPRTAVIGRVVTAGVGDPTPLERFLVAFAEGDQQGIDFDARTLQAGDEPKLTHPGGRFRFDDLGARRGRRGRGDGARAMTFRVRAVGFEDRFLRGVQVREGETTDLGDIELVPGPTLAVRVLEEGRGRPVEGARVFACDAESDRWFERWRSRDEPAWTSDTVRYGETDRSGEAVLPLPPGEAALRVGVNADGFVFAAPVEAPRDGRPVEVRLSRGATVVARVTSLAGQPAPGIPVSLVARGDELRGPRRVDARTDSGGLARFLAVQPGPHVLRTDAPRMRPRPPESWREETASVVVPERGEVEVSLRVRATADVTGRVVEAGVPLAGARVEFAVRDGDDLLRPDWREETLRAVTDADGRFLVPRIPEGEYRVGVAHGSRAMAARFDVVIREDPAPLVLSLEEAVVAGRVVDAERDQPMRGVTVRIEDLSGEGRAYIAEQTLREEPDGDLERDGDWTDPGRARTGRGGGFRFRGVAVGEALRLRVSGEFVRGRTMDVPALAPGEVREDLELRVRMGGSLEVRVNRPRERRRERLLVEVQRLDDAGLAQGRPDARRDRGRTRYEGMTPGRYRVRVGTRSDQGFEELAAAETRVRAGQRSRVRLDVE